MQFRSAFFTAAGITVVSGIFFSIIIRDLFSWLNRTLSEDEDAILVNNRLSIGFARMIDIAGFVNFWLAIERYLGIHFKQISTLARVFFGFRYGATNIFDNAGIFWNTFPGKEAEAGERTLHIELERARLILSSCWHVDDSVREARFKRQPNCLSLHDSVVRRIHLQGASLLSATL